MKRMLCAALVMSVACKGKDGTSGGIGTLVAQGPDAHPDQLPVMLNKELPFRYPPALYADKAQGNVTLRLYIDKDGAVVDDSTHVAESSNIAILDSAAIKGSRELRFVPAKSHGAPMPVSILFPVFFRHPEAPPPAGDTILKKSPAPAPADTQHR